jgi:hypothetical protein
MFNLYSYKKEVHQEITRTAYQYLRVIFGDNCEALDEMGEYLGFDETTSTSNGSLGFLKIVSGAYMEDEYDIVYHYGSHDIPNYNNIPPSIEEIIYGTGDLNREAHSSITHFWDGDSGINASTHLTDTINPDALSETTWEFTINTNAAKKIQKYFNGDYVERVIWTEPQNIWANVPPFYEIDYESPEMVNLYNNIGTLHIIRRYDYLLSENFTELWRPLTSGKGRAYNRLGRICHLVQDMAVPAHVHSTSHAGVQRMYFDIYENGISNESYSLNAFELALEDLNFVNPVLYTNPVYDMCYELNQITDHFADGRANGDDNYDTSYSNLNSIIPNLGIPTSSSEVNEASCIDMVNVLISQAVKYTAGYMLHFLLITNQLNPSLLTSRIQQSATLSTGSINAPLCLDIISKNSGNVTTYYSDLNGEFDIANSPVGLFDIVIRDPFNEYERYTKEDVLLRYGINTIDDFQITLQYNPDKVIIVPLDCATIQEAIDRIQDGGTVGLQPNTYFVEELNWRHKHISIVGNNVTLTNTNNVSAIKLEWSGINNQDIITGINFSNCMLENSYGNNGAALSLLNGASPIIQSCNFNGNILQSNHLPNNNYDQNIGGAVFIEGNSTQTVFPRFLNCNFNNNMTASANGGGAVGISGGVEFLSCNFENNNNDICPGTRTTFLNAGGAIFIYSLDNHGDIIFDNCNFEDNVGMYEANDIFIMNADNIDKILIDSCNFTFNTSSYNLNKPSIKLYTELGNFNQQPIDIEIKNSIFESCNIGAVYLCDNNSIASVNFHNNIIKNNQNQINGYGFYLKYRGDPITNDETFKFNNNTLMNITGDGLVLDCGAEYKIKNNIFTGISGYAVDGGDGTQYSTESLEINNCLFNQNGHNWVFDGDEDLDCEGNPAFVSHNNLTNTDPLLDANYAPIWSPTVKSPCINTGNPDTDGDGIPWYEEDIFNENGVLLTEFEDRDPDMSRPDIGAVPYNGNNENSVLEFHQGVKWFSIPGVDNLTTTQFVEGTDSYSHNEARYVFGEQVDLSNLFRTIDPYLTEISWNYDTTGRIIYEYGAWTYLDEVVTPNKGYKMTLTNEVPSTVKLEFDGFKPGTDNNEDYEITLIAPDTENDETSTTTLVGYYLRESQSIFDAIPPTILENISCIKTQDWFSSNVSYLNTQGIYGKSTWLQTSDITGEITLRYGTAVEIVYVGEEDATFTWGATGVGTDPYTVQTPTVFSYTEQQGYLPLIIEMDLDEYDEGNKPIEIAVFIDDDCKGASVVKDNMVLLKAYVVDDPSDIGEELTFQLVFDYKGAKSKIEDYAVMDPIQKRFITKKLTVNPKDDFAYISFNKDDIANGAIPAITTLKGNYPNPFNPETTICYDIASDTDVRLDVYNIRGQKVTTIVNEYMKPGYHSVVWSGKDENNRSVASGVYFYRLHTSDKTLTKKMMLLK